MGYIACKEVTCTEKYKKKLVEFENSCRKDTNGCWYWNKKIKSSTPFEKKQYIAHKKVISLRLFKKISFVSRSIANKCGEFYCINPIHLALRIKNYDNFRINI